MISKARVDSLSRKKAMNSALREDQSDWRIFRSPRVLYSVLNCRGEIARLRRGLRSFYLSISRWLMTAGHEWWNVSQILPNSLGKQLRKMDIMKDRLRIDL